MKLGDHVRALVGGEYRHGIDCGDRTVLFLARDPAGRPEVRRALDAEFASGGRVEPVVHREQVFAPRMVVARAFSRMRDPSAAASFGSSEAFAAWCLTGRSPEPGFAPPAGPERPAAGKRKAKPARTPARKAVPARRPARKARRRPESRGAAPRGRASERRKAGRTTRKAGPARRPAAKRKRRR